jgi:hypothetical protein
MYPKSPFMQKSFNNSIYIKPEDDTIFNFDETKIKNHEDKVSFSRIKSSIEKVSLQKYNLNISKKSCTSCQTSTVEINDMLQSLTEIKSTLCEKAYKLMAEYN